MPINLKRKLPPRPKARQSQKMRQRRTLIFGLIVLASLCLAVAAQNRQSASDESARILSLENVWNEAEVRHDGQALSLLLADAFEYTDSDGSFMNREQWLDHVTKAVDDYEQLGNSKMKIHLYGDVAVVNGEYREKLKVKGRMLIRTGRFTDTWILQKDQWKCIASQSTLVSP